LIIDNVITFDCSIDAAVAAMALMVVVVVLLLGF
jgi:hypothetical protein